MHGLVAEHESSAGASESLLEVKGVVTGAGAELERGLGARRGGALDRLGGRDRLVGAIVSRIDQAIPGARGRGSLAMRH